MIAILFVKATLIFGLALGLPPLLRKNTAALRHLLCAIALAGALLLPLTLPAPARVPAIRIPFVIQATAYATSARPLPQRVFTSFLTVWILGVLVLLIRLGVGYWRVSRVLGAATQADEPSPIPVFIADVSVPLLVGLFRPAILLPRASRRWSPSQRDAALRHELTHLDRNDLWTRLLANLVCAAYWFHPLAWVLAHRLREEQETACDDAVIASGFAAGTYAEALVAAARSYTSTPLTGCPMITRTNETSLQSRIARLLDRSRPRVSSPTTLRRAGLLFAAALCAIGSVNAVAQSPNTETVYKMNAGITAPMLIQKADPEYTDQAQAAKLSGSVLLSVVIGSNGIPHDIHVMKSLGMGLDEKAMEAVGKWQFKPAEKDGQPVAVHASIEFNFRHR